MTSWRALLLVAVLGCGSDGTSGTPDAPLLTHDGGLTDAAPTTADAAPPTVDATTADVPSSLGKLCATTAIDGGPGSCTGGVCCNAGGNTICTLPSDCPAGPGYKSCTASNQCQGSICCQLPSMTFCTKNNVCSAYGGTVLP